MYPGEDGLNVLLGEDGGVVVDFVEVWNEVALDLGGLARGECQTRLLALLFLLLGLGCVPGRMPLVSARFVGGLLLLSPAPELHVARALDFGFPRIL